MLVTSIFAAALAAAAPDAASDAQASEAAPAAAPAVISYPPAFFESFAPGNAFEMVSRLPGFAFDGGADVRGFEGAAGNVLIDGERPASKSDNLESILRRIPFSQVERIDLIRGGAPGIDMQGQSVIANVIRKQGGGFRGLAAISNNAAYDGRNAQGARLEGSGKWGVTSWEAGVVGGEGIDDGAGDGPAVHLDAAGRPVETAFLDTDGDVLNVNATGAIETPLAGGKLRVNGRFFAEVYEYDELGRVTFPTPYLARGQDEVDTVSTELGGRYSRVLGARTSLELVGIQQTESQQIASNFEAPGEAVAFTRDSDLGESIGRAKLSYRHNDRLSFEAGAEGAFNWLEGVTRLAVNGAPVPVPAGDVRVEEKRGEVFGKAVWQAHRKLTLEGGLRYEGSNISSEGDVELEKTLYFLKPRAALTWAPDEKTQLRLRLERVVGQLDFDDFVSSDSVNSSTLTAGNPDLDPEQEWVVEAALERRFLDGGAVVLTARRSNLTDVIDRAPIRTLEGVFDAPANIGDGIRDELVLNLTLPLTRLGLKGAQLQAESTWRRSEVTDPTTLQKREISGLRPLEWEAHFTHDLPRLNTTWGVNVFGAWRETYYRFDEVDVVKLKNWVELFAEVRPRPDINVRLAVSNVGERGFRRTRYVYPGGRDVTLAPEVFDRDRQFGRLFYVRVRKSFGG
ncbi:TonB-dependent receptor plug domain-containing protein [Phenylobacterium terrae]|uniref:TonB-dependent receptor plug domain-containing protein n=1 Tax=Phenylobacterium terrae TaxID=2665495 RepID=A0ABW4N1K5_9CAUL